MHQNVLNLGIIEQKICKAFVNNLTKLYCQRLNETSVHGEMNLDYEQSVLLFSIPECIP